MAQFSCYPKIPGSTILGQHTMALSAPVVIASDQSAIHVIADSSALPTGASTSALQTQISGQLPSSLGAKTIANALAVAIASDQTVPVSGSFFQATQPVSAVSLPLPTGASTSALQTQISGQLPTTLGAKTTANSLAVTIASDQTVPVSGSFFQATQPVSAVSLPLPTGAAVSSKQPALGTAGSPSVDVISVQGTALMTALKVDGSAVTQPTSSAQQPASLGQKTSANSFAVVLASDQSAVAMTPNSSKGRTSSNAPVYNDYSVTNVNTSAYVQLVASTTSTTNLIEIFDSSGQAMIIGVGGAGSEVVQLYTLPGGNGAVPLSIPAGSRVSIKALTGSSSSGYLIINFYS